MSQDEILQNWFAVRSIFRWQKDPETSQYNYEERITIWHAASIEQAIASAEREARDYAIAIEASDAAYCEVAQAYEMSDAPENGAEIFSLMRESDLQSSDYITHFFATGTELQRDCIDP